MAKTKFLDYTGLAKLVEKIKNTYVNKSGSTMTGTLKTVENYPAIIFRDNGGNYTATLNYDTESAEALAINLKNVATSFMINSGVDGTTWTSVGYQSKVTPTIHVRKNCVGINKYIPDNTSPEYKLDVNGDVKADSFTGKLGTATVGGATRPMYLSGGTPTECTYSLNADVPDGAVFTDEKVKQVINTTDGAIHPILFSAWAEDNKGEMPQENHACINWNFSVIPQNGTLKATNFSGTTFSGDTFNGNTFTGKAKTANTADIASLAGKLSINAGSVSADDVLVIGNYAGGPILMGGRVGPGEFTPSGIVLKITDTDIENEIKNAIVWPTA